MPFPSDLKRQGPSLTFLFARDATAKQFEFILCRWPQTPQKLVRARARVVVLLFRPQEIPLAIVLAQVTLYQIGCRGTGKRTLNLAG